MIKLGMICEYGTGCGFLEKPVLDLHRVCTGEHVFKDFNEEERDQYACVIEIPKNRLGMYKST